jgi:hypothetical protein
MTLRFSSSQVDNIAVSNFLQRMVSIVATSDANAPAHLDTPEGKKTLRQQFEKGASYGLESELDLGRYIITAWLLGPDFDTRYPAIQEILTHKSMDPSQKMEAIELVTGMLFKTLENKTAT